MGTKIVNAVMTYPSEIRISLGMGRIRNKKEVPNIWGRNRWEILKRRQRRLLETIRLFLHLRHFQLSNPNKAENLRKYFL